MASKAGRPAKMTKQTIQKLKEAFMFGASDREACMFSDISPSLLYEYQKKTDGFLEQKEVWKKQLAFHARKVVADKIKQGDLQTSKWYLERKVKGEFSLREEHTGADAGEIQLTIRDFTAPVENENEYANQNKAVPKN